jgi:hypothetical protein
MAVRVREYLLGHRSNVIRCKSPSEAIKTDSDSIAGGWPRANYVANYSLFTSGSKKKERNYSN